MKNLNKWLIKVGKLIRIFKLYKLYNLKNHNRKKTPYRLVFFCGKNGMEYLNSSLLSVYKNWTTLPDITIITDGTPTSFIEERLIVWPSKVSIDTWDTCANYYKSKGNHQLYNYAQNEIWGKKLVSVLYCAEKSPILYSDTDVLWFSDLKIEDLIKPSIKMSQDIEHCYSENMLKELEETELLGNKPLNAGVIYLDGDFSIFKKWEKLCDYLMNKADNRTEQTSFAVLTNNFGDSFRVNEILVQVNDLNTIIPTKINYQDICARHYVNTKAWLFWRDFLLLIVFKIK